MRRPTRQKIPLSDVFINLIGQNGETQLAKLSKMNIKDNNFNIFDQGFT